MIDVWRVCLCNSLSEKLRLCFIVNPFVSMYVCVYKISVYKLL